MTLELNQQSSESFPLNRLSTSNVDKNVEIALADIVLFPDRRSMDGGYVRILSKSIADEGLMYPIAVYRLRGILEGKFGLSSGAHRYAAFSLLGRESIPAVILDRALARAWEASENIHRAELRILDRSEAIVRYAKSRSALPTLAERPQQQKQPQDRGYRTLERELGFNRKIIAEAFGHNAIPPAIKSAIRKGGLDDNRKILTAVGKISSLIEQKRYVDKLANKGTMAELGEKKMRANRAPKRTGLKRLIKAWRSSNVSAVFEDQPLKVREKFLRHLADV